MKKFITFCTASLIAYEAFAQTHTIQIGTVNSTDATIKPIFGVIAGPDPPTGTGIGAINTTKQLQDIGILSIRNNDYYDDRLDMPLIFNCGGSTYPSYSGCDANDDKNYNWTASDKQFQSYIDGGFDSFLRLGGEYNNATREYDFTAPRNATEEANWIIAAQKIVGRYNSWQGKTGVLKYADIITEFPGGKFWDRPNSAFFTFFTQAVKDIKSAFPAVKIGGPGMVGGVTFSLLNGSDTTAAGLLKELYRQKVRPDWFGWHLFTDDPQDWADAAKQYQDLVDGAGRFTSMPWAGTGFFRGMEVIVDAYGMVESYKENASGNLITLTATEKDRVFNRKESGALAAAAWIIFQYANIERAYFYRCGDPNSDPAASPASKSVGGQGLFYGDGKATYKPKAHAIRLCSRMYKEFPNLLSLATPSVGASGSKLWALAARANGTNPKHAILLANYQGYQGSTTTVDWTATIGGKTISSADYMGEIFQVDDSQDGKTAKSWDGRTINIPAGTVQLLVLTPKTTDIREQQANFSAFSITPNPAQNFVSIKFTLLKPERISLKLFNALGQEVAQMFDETLSAGEYERSLDISYWSLSSGAYFLRLQTPTIFQQQTVQVIR